jgi:tetratricopeptide (TPR) repeat protein
MALLCACGEREKEGETARAPEALVEIPEVALDRLGDAVAASLRHRLDTIDALSLDPSTTAEKLAGAYGGTGMAFHAHDLNAPAEACYRNARTLMPDEFRWTYYLGQLQAEMGNAEAAIALFREALALRPGDLPTLTSLGRQHVLSLELDEGERILHEVLEEDPSSAASHFFLGQAAISRGDPSKAVEHFHRTLELQPEATRAHLLLSGAYRSLGDQERADEHLARRGEGRVVPDDPWMDAVRRLIRGTHPLVEAGTAAFSRGELASAAELFRRAVQEDPEHATAWLNLGTALFRLGRADEAREAFEEALRLDPGRPRSHRNLGTLLAAAGEFPEAIEHYRTALKSNPGDVDSHFNLANALRRSRRYSEGIASFRRVLELDPANTRARFGVALCLVRSGRFPEALDELETGLSGFPEDLMLVNATARLLAACPEDAIRDGRRAVTLARKAVEREPLSEYIETLAMAHAERREFEQAVELQRGVLEAAKAAGRTDLLPGLQANLDRYEANRPCRDPWPED